MGEYEELMDKLTFFLRTKKLQDELLDVNGMILTWIFHYCEKNNIPLYKDENIYRLIKRSRELLAKINPSNRELTAKKTTEDATDPSIRLCFLVGILSVFPVG